MKHQKKWFFASAGSVTVGAIALVLSQAGGCGQSIEDLNATKGNCPISLDDGNPCTLDFCTGIVVENVPLDGGEDCARGQNAGSCKGGLCVLACSSMPSSCTCKVDGDCTPSTECHGWECSENGTCEPLFRAGFALKKQDQGDCETIQCTADGGTELVPNSDSADKPSDVGCILWTCKNGKRSDPAPAGSLCVGQEGKVCRDDGTCVECVDNGDCSGAGSYCDSNSGNCFSCVDGVRNGNETGIDCGGPCGKCNGEDCDVPGDCHTKLCFDQVCCDEDCAKQCYTCKGAVPGVCAAIEKLEPDNNSSLTCTGSNACDGSGACKKAPGQVCDKTKPECASGNCKGFCSNDNASCTMDINCGNGKTCDFECTN